MPSAKTLRVFANPWHHLDHEGIPAGACACDPDEHTPERRFVGATLKAKQTRKADPRRGITARHRITFEFSAEPQEIPNTTYYRKAISTGQLIAADEPTAKACDFKKGAYLDPKSVLETEKRDACVRFQAEHDGELPPFCKQKCEEPKPEKTADKPASKPSKAGDR